MEKKVLNVMTCDVRIDGRIDKGAVEKFKEAARKFNQVDNESYFAEGAGITVCLNSGGGDLSAVKEIGVLLTEEISFAGRLSTLVKNGDECLSACALVFMLGRSCFDTVCGSSRFLEPLARLGFHAPYIPTDNIAPLSVLSSAYEAALKDFATILSFGTQVDFEFSNEMFPGYLIQEMLKYGKDEYFYIDTVERLLIMNINLVGPTKIRTHGIDAIINICNNAALLRNRNPYSYLTIEGFETIIWQKVNSKSYDFQRYRMAFYYPDEDAFFSLNLPRPCALEGYTDKTNTSMPVVDFNKSNSYRNFINILPNSLTSFESYEPGGPDVEGITSYSFPYLMFEDGPLEEANTEIDKILIQLRDPLNAWLFSSSDTLIVNLVE